MPLYLCKYISAVFFQKLHDNFYQDTGKYL